MSPWIAIIGRSHDGKPLAVAALKEAFEARGLRLGGFLQRALGRDDLGRAEGGFELVFLDDGARLPLARRSPSPELCDWAFDASAFEEARARATRPGLHAVVLEAGPLESAERGHWPTLLRCLQGGGAPVILCVRRHNLAPLALRLPDPIDALELPAEDEEVRAFAERAAEVAHAHARAREAG